MPRSRLRKFFASTLPLVVMLVLLFSALYLAADATTSESGLGDYYEAVFWAAGLTLAGLALTILGRVLRLMGRARRSEPGSKLTLRLVILFVVLTVPPAVVVYWFSSDFLRRGIDSWFDAEVYSAMGDAQQVGRSLLELQERQFAGQMDALAARLVNQDDVSSRRMLRDLRRQAGALELSVLDASGNVLASVSNELNVLPDLPDSFMLVQARRGGYIETEDAGDRRQIRVLALIDDDDLNRVRLLQGIFAVTSVDQQLANIGEMTERMNQLAFLRENLKRSFLLILSMVLLLSVLLAVLLAFNTARRLVNPIGRLSAATRTIAAGDYQRRLAVPKQDDELGFLVESFNQMTDEISRASSAAISSREEAERRRDYLETVLGRLSSGVISLDPERRILTANEAAADILGIALRALRHVPLTELRQREPQLEPFVHTVEQRLAESAGEWRQEVRLPRPRGEQILMLRAAPLASATAPASNQSSASPPPPLPSSVLAHQGSSGYVVVFNDLTDLVQAQREAAWGEVARRLAHEVKNPLTPIQLSAERLRHKYLDTMEPEQAAVMDKATRTIVAQVEALKKLVDAFSEYARAPSLNRQPVQLSTLADDVLALYESAASDWQIERHWMADEPLVAVDADRIRQLLHNLIKNAKEAVLAEPLQLRLSTALSGTAAQPTLTFSIADNGPGLPADIQARVFQPYATNKPRGSGLGLAIVKKIAEEHDASISANNLPQGGAQFDLVLPLPPGQQQAQRRVG